MSSDSIRVFISHKRIPHDPNEATEEQILIGNQATDKARLLHKYLTEVFKYQKVFIDVSDMRSGEKWEETIYENIRKSDVLIVLLQAKTAESDWIQREVDMARGLNIQILPVKIEASINLELARTRLAIGGIQEEYFTGKVEDAERIHHRLLDLSRITRIKQREWVRMRQQFWWPNPARQKLHAATFRLDDYPLPDGEYTRLHLAKGDITLFAAPNGKPAFDVIVNSENNYMQMARVHEVRRLSGRLRVEGALFEDVDKLIEDTLQDQIDIQLANPATHYGRPVMGRPVIVTHAGHPDSELVRRTGARYMFHVITVRVDKTGKFNADFVSALGGMEQAIHSCLSRVIKVNESRGVIFPAGSHPHERDLSAAANYQPITSIIFPLLGTGHGELPISETASFMIQAIKSFPTVRPADAEKLHLTDIYLCALTEDDAELVEIEMAHYLSKG